MALNQKLTVVTLNALLMVGTFSAFAEPVLSLPPLEPIIKQQPDIEAVQPTALMVQPAEETPVATPVRDAVNPAPSTQTAPMQTTAPEPMATPATPSTAATSLKIGTSAKTVPMGTHLKVVFNTTMDSRITTLGEPFSAFIADDFASTSDGLKRIILPAGTLVRGRIEQVRRPSFFSRGGMIDLAFDHVVLPTGELMPLDLKLSTTNEMVNRKGNLYTDPGIQAKVQEGFQDGVGVFNNIKGKGVQAGQQIGDGLGQLVTVPAAIVGGTIAGAGVTAGKAAIAVVGKGDSVVVNPGDSVTIDFGGSFTLPAE